jgi:signal transduction histidine kinase
VRAARARTYNARARANRFAAPFGAMAITVTSAHKRLLLFAGFLTAFSTLLVVTNYALYRRARSHLDAQMGERLRSIAMALAHTVEATTPDSLPVGTVDASWYESLVLTREENGLSNVVVIAPDGRTVADLAGYSSPGESNPFIALDVGAVGLARAGISSTTSLYRTGEIYMKSAYAPIVSDAGAVIGIVGVEAGASFFAQLRELASLIAFISVGNASVVLALGLLFYRQSRSLDRAQERLLQQENLASLGRMVATIAHEIRNPLSIIRASAERVERKHAIHDEALVYIVEEVDDLDRILTGYLEFAQARPSQFGPVSALKVVQRCVAAVEDEARARGVVVATGPAADATLRGDEGRIRQAVLNVLLNAVQSARARVDVTVASEGDSARIEVADDGPGFDAAILKDATRPFVTTRASGSGLGLAVTQSVIDEHRGTLDIQSRERGARVVITLPLAREPEA